MNISLFHINRHTVISWYGFMAALNLLLGFFFWGMQIDNFGLIHHIIGDQIFGLLTLSTVLGALVLFNPRSSSVRLLVILAAVFVGSFITASFSIPNRVLFFTNLIVCTLLGSMIFGFAFYGEKMTLEKANLEKEQSRRLQVEKQITEARLRTLQAQIEPHFLFNTLSNILNLFDTDLEKGKSMQKDLIVYLRSSLPKFRTDFTTVREEIDLVRAYLNIYKVRMGDRLLYRAEIEGDVTDLPFPPMLIQPLVENAIKHGIEPKIEGGEIRIDVRKAGSTIRITVADTGLGMAPDSGPRTGLTNIRERLALLYGEKGRLILEENRPCGLKAIIEVPDDRT